MPLAHMPALDQNMPWIETWPCVHVRPGCGLQAKGVGNFKVEDEEFEDDSGNVYNKKTYDDLKRQGLI